MTFKGALKTFSEVQELLIERNSEKTDMELTALEGLAVGLQELTQAMEAKLNSIDSRLSDLERRTG